MMISGILEEWPVAAIVLAMVIRALLARQGSLTWSEYRAAHGLKRRLFPILADMSLVGFPGWVNEKGGRDDDEFLLTLDLTSRHIARRLMGAGGDLHLINSVKRRPDGSLSAGHVVFLHDDGSQTEAYWFRNGGGTADLYAHHEPSPARPLAHLGAEQQSDGDPRGVVTSVFMEV